MQNIIKILYVFDLTGLSDPIALLLESLLLVELHRIFNFVEIPREEHETTDEGACSALPMIAMNYRHISDIFY